VFRSSYSINRYLLNSGNFYPVPFSEEWLGLNIRSIQDKVNMPTLLDDGDPWIKAG